MREKSDRVRLLHILESARLIAEWIRDIEKENSSLIKNSRKR